MHKSPTIIVVIFFIFFSCSTHKSQIRTKVEVYINSTWTKEMLEKTQTQLKLKHIDFIFSELIFNQKGELKSIKIEVNCNDGYIGSADNKELRKSSKFGFFRDYAKSSNFQFMVGTF